MTLDSKECTQKIDFLDLQIEMHSVDFSENAIEILQYINSLLEKEEDIIYYDDVTITKKEFNFWAEKKGKKTISDSNLEKSLEELSRSLKIVYLNESGGSVTSTTSLFTLGRVFDYHSNEFECFKLRSDYLCDISDLNSDNPVISVYPSSLKESGPFYINPEIIQKMAEAFN
jgi:hypothetical protein